MMMPSSTCDFDTRRKISDPAATETIADAGIRKEKGLRSRLFGVQHATACLQEQQPNTSVRRINNS